MVTVAFIWCFTCFNWFSYCKGKCICAGQGNTIVSHFVVQRGDFTVAIACVPCGPRRSLIYAWAWGFCGCVLKTVCGWTSKTWLLPYACCGLHFIASVTCVLSLDHSAAPFQLWRCESRMSGATRDHSRLSDHGPDRSRQPWWWWPATNTTDAGYHNWRPG